MSEVTLQIGGRPYTISCADGEEAHVQHLARIVDAKLAGLGKGAPGDARNLVLAALILADEVEEARRTAAPAPDGAFEENVAHGLEALADRLEAVAAALEKPMPAA